MTDSGGPGHQAVDAGTRARLTRSSHTALMLYSLADVRELVFAAVGAVAARTIVEVGSEAGLLTTHLVSWAETVDGRVWCVDPSPSDAVRRMASDSTRVSLVESPSPKALTDIPPADVYLLDGDHNYFVVAGELSTVRSRCQGRNWLVLLQDVGWPTARRDFYYAPDRLPNDGLHPHTFRLGVRPGRTQAGAGGFRTEGLYALALAEGGPRNGVLTALEDFVRDHDDVNLMVAPSVFGLAAVYPAGAPFEEALRVRFGWADGNPMLERLERNRVDMLLRILDLQDEVSSRALDHDRVVQLREVQLTKAQAREAELREEVARLAAAVDALRTELGASHPARP